MRSRHPTIPTASQAARTFAPTSLAPCDFAPGINPSATCFHTNFQENFRGFRGGFTLMELLVTLSIAFVLIALTVPLLGVLKRDGSVTSGLNTVIVAAEAARQLATTETAKKDPLADSGSTSGTAFIVTNSNEIRLVKHDASLTISGATEGKGFVDVDGRDYINLSPRNGMVGIKRNGPSKDDLQFVAPPFAVRFNEHGNLIFGNPSSANGAYMVYYDSQYDGTMSGASDRGNGYDPNLPANKPWNATAGRYELPFDEIETVVGVMVFDAQLVPDLTADAGAYIKGDGTHGTPGQLIQQHGTAIFFNRVTGAPVYRK